VAFDPRTAQLIRRKARRLVGQAGLRLQDRDDIEQELTLELLARRDRYDPARGAWPAFAHAVLERTGSNLVRYRRAAKRDVQRLEPLDDEHPPAVDDETVDFAAEVPVKNHAGDSHDETVDLDLDLAAVIAMLPAKYRTVVKLVLKRGVQGAARVLGVNRSTVYARLHELRVRAEVAPLANYR